MSTLARDARHGLRIARVELRRSVRKSFGTRKRQLTVLGFVALFAPVLRFWYRVAREAGRDAAATGTLSVDALGVQLSLVVVVFAVMGAMRVVQQGRPDGDALLLTATTPRAVLLGTTIHAAVQLVGFVSLPTALFAGGFALGAGVPGVLLTTVLAIVPLFTAVTLLGTVLGQVVVLGLLRSQSLRRVSRAFGLVLLLVLLALSYAIVAPVVGSADILAPAAVVAVPAVKYLGFAFLGTPFGPGVDAGSLVVAGAVLVSVPALFAVANRLAPRLWFADATPTNLLQRDASRPAPASPSSGDAVATRPGGPFPPRIGPKPVRVALGLWTRWLRIPVRFSPLFPLVIVLVTAVFGTVDDPDSLPLVAGGAVVFVGVYVSGAVFGLNPLGEAGEMRTVEALSATSPRTLVVGHAVAGLLVGAPLSLVGVAVLAIATGSSPATAVLLVVLAVASTVAGAAVGVGIGAVLPSGDAQRTYRGYEVATPSQWALVGYMFAVMALVGVAAVGGVFAVSALGATTSHLGVAVPVAAAAVLLGVGYGGYRTATRRFGAPPFADSEAE